MRENYFNFEPNIKKGYNIVFLVKKDVNILDINFKKVNDDMEKILFKANLIL